MSDQQFGELADRMEQKRVRLAALHSAGARHAKAGVDDVGETDWQSEDWQEPMDLAWLAYKAGGMDPRD